MNETSPHLPCRLALVIGGARSGKSRWAQAEAERVGAERLFIATAEAFDEEMRDRIRRHREDRRDGWLTIEEPLDLRVVLGQEARPGRIVLVDCLTLWLSNLMHAGRAPADEIAHFVDALRQLGGPAILVSNEVGLGIAPATPLGREFRDWQGRLNSEVARVADVVVAMTAGLPRLVKPAAFPQLRFA